MDSKQLKLPLRQLEGYLQTYRLPQHAASAYRQGRFDANLAAALALCLVALEQYGWRCLEHTAALPAGTPACLH